MSRTKNRESLPILFQRAPSPYHFVIRCFTLGSTHDSVVHLAAPTADSSLITKIVNHNRES